MGELSTFALRKWALPSLPKANRIGSTVELTEDCYGRSCVTPTTS